VIGCKQDPQCETFVCEFDDYCCTTLWDKTCSYYASEKCDETNVVFGTTKQNFNAVEEDGLNINIIWKVSLAVFGIMALCILCCCFFVFVLKCFCNNHHKERSYANTNSTNERSENAETATLNEAECEDFAETNGKKVGLKKQQRGKSMDHYHVRVMNENDENGLTKVKKTRKLKKRMIKIGDDESVNEEENIAHPLFDRKCRSNSF